MLNAPYGVGCISSLLTTTRNPTGNLWQVSRVLKPGGIFSWADLRSIDEVAALQQTFEGSGLKVIKTTDITHNVLQALELMNQRKQTFIQTNLPSLLKQAFQEFAAMKDSQLYESFQTGQAVYLSYVLEK